MKKIILIIFLAIGVTANAQIELSIYQDAKLAVMEDDAGNSPFTADIVTMIRLYNGGNRSANWSKQIFFYPYFEFADLSDGRYIRYSMGLGYRFKLPLKINVSPSFDYGVINRWNASSFSYNLGVDIGIKLTKKLSLSTFMSITERTDLKGKYGTTKPTYNFYVGLTYQLSK